MKRRTRAILSIMLIAFAVLCFLAWNLYFREALTYKDVVVLTKELKVGEVLTTEHLTIESIDENAVVEGAITKSDYQTILGKTSVIYLPANSQLVANYFGDGLKPSEGEVVFQIPIEWIYQMPQSIRRGDLAKVYIIHQDDLVYEEPTATPTPTATATPISAPTAYIVNGQSVTPSTTEVPTPSPSPTVSPTPTVEPKMSVLPYFFNENEEMIFECRVMYVKDTTNREIVTITSQTGYDRLDGSAKNYSLEILATDEMINQLKEAFAAGYKFIIVYE